MIFHELSLGNGSKYVWKLTWIMSESLVQPGMREFAVACCCSSPLNQQNQQETSYIFSHLLLCYEPKAKTQENTNSTLLLHWWKRTSIECEMNQYWYEVVSLWKEFWIKTLGRFLDSRCSRRSRESCSGIVSSKYPSHHSRDLSNDN